MLSTILRSPPMCSSYFNTPELALAFANLQPHASGWRILRSQRCCAAKSRPSARRPHARERCAYDSCPGRRKPRHIRQLHSPSKRFSTYDVVNRLPVVCASAGLVSRLLLTRRRVLSSGLRRFRSARCPPCSTAPMATFMFCIAAIRRCWSSMRAQIPAGLGQRPLQSCAWPADRSRR